MLELLYLLNRHSLLADRVSDNFSDSSELRPLAAYPSRLGGLLLLNLLHDVLSHQLLIAVHARIKIGFPASVIGVRQSGVVQSQVLFEELFSEWTDLLLLSANYCRLPTH